MISLEGSIVDLITPFDGDGIDEKGFAEFVAWQICEGTNALVTCTATGEGTTLTAAEKERLIRICVEVSNGRVPVIAATGTYGTDGTIALTRMAKAAGADAVLVVTPYYSRPSQEGLYRHFEAVALAVDIPIIVHNDPTRTGVDLHRSTIDRLGSIPSIAGLCEASPDPARFLPMARDMARGWVDLCGHDPSTLAFRRQGGHGSLSVAANVVPKLCATFLDAGHDGGLAWTRQASLAVAPMLQALQRDHAPIGIKYALSLLRPDLKASYRLPLMGPCDASRAALTAALHQATGWLGMHVSPSTGNMAVDKMARAALANARTAERASLNTPISPASCNGSSSP